MSFREIKKGIIIYLSQTQEIKSPGMQVLKI
jgi:hypothetical protein